MNPSDPEPTHRHRAGRWIVGPTGILTLCAFSTFLGVALIATLALPIIILDAIGALIVLIPPMMAGLWIAPLIGLRRAAVRWQLLIGAILGVGMFSLLVLLLGMMGWLQQPLWIAILAVCTGLGVVRLRSLLRDVALSKQQEPTTGSVGRDRLLWLLTVPFLVAGLLAAANPPGIIWSEEGLGYDVLEYHLEMPKEYFHAGLISYAPHNVYANFPANVEMLYLINMVLRGEDIETGTSANVIHLYLSVLAVFAAWCIGSMRSKRAGILCGVSLATTGWIPYLAGLAYVENGLLAFGLLSVGALLRAVQHVRAHVGDRQGPETRREIRAWLIICGLSAGFACGCKYTAVPMIALPVIIGAAWVGGSLRTRLRSAVIVSLATLVTFSPWLVKNTLMTGNPVFPLAHSLFQTYPPGWDQRTATRWQRGHALHSTTPESALESSDLQTAAASLELGRRGTLLWQNIPADHYQRFGAILLVCPLLLLRRRRRTGVKDPSDFLLWFIAAAQLGVWILATHLFARFAVPLLIPLCLLAGWGMDRASTCLWHAGTRLALVVGIAWNLAFVIELHEAESMPELPVAAIYDGEFPPFRPYVAVNEGLSAQARVLMIGDARAFYYRRHVDYTTVFNVNPFADAVARNENPEAILVWLRDHGYTHVLVHWAEISRLRRTYGFPASITPALFVRLHAAGLSLTWQAHKRPNGIGNVQLFSVPRSH